MTKTDLIYVVMYEDAAMICRTNGLPYSYAFATSKIENIPKRLEEAESFCKEARLDESKLSVGKFLFLEKYNEKENKGEEHEK